MKIKENVNILSIDDSITYLTVRDYGSNMESECVCVCLESAKSKRSGSLIGESPRTHQRRRELASQQNRKVVMMATGSGVDFRVTRT